MHNQWPIMLNNNAFKVSQKEWKWQKFYLLRRNPNSKFIMLTAQQASNIIYLEIMYFFPSNCKKTVSMASSWTYWVFPQ